MERPKGNLLKYALAAAVVFAVMAAALTLKRAPESVIYTRNLMGTVVRITIIDGDRGRFDEASEAAFREIERLEGAFSSYKEGSMVARVNRSAGKGPVEVTPEVMEVARAAMEVAGLSGGAFDPSIGALSKVWGPSGERGVVPAASEVSRLLPLVDYRKVYLGPGDTIALAEDGMALNLGGVAKGYIAGRAAEALKANGVARAIVHAGGDMLLVGAEGREPFTIGIQHPREDRLLGEAHVGSGAVATSGDYERYFEKDGVRYHHILDPRTGMPARGAMSATVVAKDPTLADALSTAVFVLGAEKGIELIEGLEGVEGVVVGTDGRARVSSGFKGKIY